MTSYKIRKHPNHEVTKVTKIYNQILLSLCPSCLRGEKLFSIYIISAEKNHHLIYTEQPEPQRSIRPIVVSCLQS